MASAANRVLGNYELMENIITCIPDRRTIFLAQRVSTLWHQLIQRSKSIRHALYASPSKPIQPARTVYGSTAVYAHGVEIEMDGTWRKAEKVGYGSFDAGPSDGSHFLYRLEFRWERPSYARNGSYRGLKLTNPPCTQVQAEVVEEGEDGKWVEGRLTSDAVLRDYEGITVGLLEDLALNAATNGAARPPKPVFLIIGLAVSFPDGARA